MKKFLSLLLVVCMLLTSSIILSSCSKVTEKKLEKDPQKVLSTALEKTNSQFFEDDAKIDSIIKKTLKKGSITIDLEAEALEENANIAKITETLYIDSENKKYVSDTLVNYNNEDLTAKIFIDENGLILNGNSVFGTDNSYAIIPSTLAESFSTSDLAKLFPLKGEDLTEVTNALRQFADSYKTAFESDEDEREDNANQLLEVLNPQTATEKIERADGKKVNCVILTYTINNATLRAALNKSLEQSNVTDETTIAAMTEVLDELDQTVDLMLTLKIYMNKKSSEFEKIEIIGTAKDKESSETADINATMTFSEEEIALVVDCTVEEENATFSVKLTKTREDDTTTYALVATGKTDGISKEVLNASYAYNKDSGEFTALVESEELLDGENLEIKGKIESTKKTATISINSIKMDDITVEMALSITFNADADMPAAPTDAKDVTTLTKDDIEQILKDFQNSKLGKLISAQS